MKILFWLIGASCTGKSYLGKKIADNLGVRLVHLDTINDRIDIDKMTKEQGYKTLLNNLGDLAVIDGIIPFTFKYDMSIIKPLLKDYKIIYVLCEPDYVDYLMRVKSRKIEIPDSDPFIMAEKDLTIYNDKLKTKVKRYLSVKTEEDIKIISLEQIRNLRYQHEGFTDVKYKELSINPIGKSVLDLGCSSCMYEKYFMKAGAKSYTGLDVNFSYLINKNAHLFDINNLEKWNKPADLVVCSSVIHYIHDKEKFIKECARLTNEVFVLELPVSRQEGVKIVLGSRGLYFTTKDMTEEIIKKYFSSFDMIGQSIVEDGSYRLIYHCFK